MMKCPKCGYKRQARDDAFVLPTECPSCGIVYAKHDTVSKSKADAYSIATPAHLRPSPVDPDSLKKARERVEKRLRNRMEIHDKDERHAKTLELARKLSAEEMRRRSLESASTREEKTEAVSKEEQPHESQIDANQQEEAVLLDDMIGVQLYSRKQDTIDDAVEAEEETSTQAAAQTPENGPSADSDPEEIAGATSEEIEPDQQTSGPEDVLVETVLLSPVNKALDELPKRSSESEEANQAEDLQPEAVDDLPEYIAAASTETDSPPLSAKLMRLLPAVAWLMLLAGVVGAVLSWTTINYVEAGVRIPVPNSPGSLPLGLLLGFAYLATGALGFAFFWVSSLISRQLKEIQKLLMVHPISMVSEEKEREVNFTL